MREGLRLHGRELPELSGIDRLLLHQRGDAVRVDRVDRGAGREQHAHARRVPLGGGGHQCCAAVRSRERANSEWTRLKRKHGDLLADYSLNVVRVDLGPTKGIFYRLRAGPIAWEDVAKSLCENLIKRKVGCLIVRPGG